MLGDSDISFWTLVTEVYFISYFKIVSMFWNFKNIFVTDIFILFSHYTQGLEKEEVGFLFFVLSRIKSLIHIKQVS